MISKRIITEKIKAYETMRLPIIGRWWYRLITAYDMRCIKRETIPKKPMNNKNRKEVVIASLTSFPARIGYVQYAIKSLMIQTYKPDRIVLSLSENQFPGRKLPDEIESLRNYGLEIYWTKDYYGHKKYKHLVEQQKENELVITFDDDIVYSPLCIERLVKKHQQYPGCLVCERAQAINVRNDKLYNPGRWDTISDVGVKVPSYSLNPSPGGGCLIPYGVFHEDATDEEKFTRLAYKNDDLWYMFMCANNHTKIIKTRKYHKTFSLIQGSQVVQMATENVQQCKNVEVMHELIKEYPDAWKRIAGNAS